MWTRCSSKGEYNFKGMATFKNIARKCLIMYIESSDDDDDARKEGKNCKVTDAAPAGNEATQNGIS